MNRWLFLLMIFFTAEINAKAFYHKKAEGWFWYETLHKKTLQPSKPEHPKTPLAEDKPLTPTEQILAQRSRVEQTLHQAIISPSIDNIKAYLNVQRALMNQSQRFAQNWQTVLLHYPDLDETRIHPVNQSARHLYLAFEETRKTQQLQKLAKDYGLYFFFKGTCVYCESFANTLKHFSQKYRWSVLPISLDGESLSAFPEFQHDNGLAERLNIQTVPALIAFHTKTKQLIPLSFKMISLSELEAVVDKQLRGRP